MLDGMPGLNNKEAKPWRKGVLTGLFILIPVLLGISLWFSLNSPTLREAPESERVLNAQVELPFQVLIPAYLPKQFKREKVEIITDQPGPNGEKMVKLIYATRKGETLTLSEWLPADQEAAKTVSNIRRCLCLCRAVGQCNMQGMSGMQGMPGMGMNGTMIYTPVPWYSNPWWVLGWVLLALVVLAILVGAYYGLNQLIRRSRSAPPAG